MILFDKSISDFLMEFDRARKTGGLTSQPLEPGSQRQVVALNPLGIDFPGQVFVGRDFPREGANNSLM